ncbi:MAG: M28 family peptidase [Balneolaceae bacterium]
MNPSVSTVLFLLALSGWLLSGCETGEPRFSLEKQGREVPVFSAGNAYHIIEQQLSNGPRNPGSEGHRSTKEYLEEKLREYAGSNSVFVQSFQHQGYNEEVLEMYNLIAAFEPARNDRILLAAHWDTRPRGEEDPDRPEDPIPGADDGGSGVGVLLELARIFHENPPPVGVDIILFDGEDFGRSGDLQNYFLGARFWGNNPPVPGYHPRFGILLDMVGGQGAQFLKERHSLQFAPFLVDAVWETAHDLGYEGYFPDQEGSYISDDHMIVEQLTGIPMINIIHHRRNENGSAAFPEYWHTQRDNLEIIDRNTLQAVGDLMTELIYNRIGGNNP